MSNPFECNYFLSGIITIFKKFKFKWEIQIYLIKGICLERF